LSLHIGELVGGFNHLKNMKVNGKDHISYIVENKTCLKPSTRWHRCDLWSQHVTAFVQQTSQTSGNSARSARAEVDVEV